MIKRLKRKFIALSMAALLVLLVGIVAGMNLINYSSVVDDADSVLQLLSQNKGSFPGIAGGRPGDKLPPEFSPELPYESRFFTVFFDEKGNAVYADVSKITAVDQQTAVALAETALDEREAEGFVGQYRFMVNREFGGKRITFLDCGRKLDAFYRFFTSSVLMSLLGFAIVFVIVFILAGRIVKPIAESYEKQRSFITNAGHEIKTPLTIIQANADLLEMELGAENESLSDIQAQTKRLKTLTEQLVQLSHMEETENNMVLIAFPLSEVVLEELRQFQALAAKDQKTLQCYIEPLLTLNGNDRAIRQLISILLDNALKYSQPGATITARLVKQGNTAMLSVHNPTGQAIAPEQLNYVFDRFYRTDHSRNSETGGHGIGLSIAKAIVSAHNGKIGAATCDGRSFSVTASFPL